MLAVVNASIGHGDFGGNLLAGDLILAQIDTGDVHFLDSIWVDTSVAGDEKVVRYRIVDACLLGERVVMVLC